MSLHIGFCLCIDPLQRLTRIGDREQHFFRLPACAVFRGDLQRLPGQQQLVVATVLRVPQNDFPGITVHVTHLD
ncbi:hypothetical protein D9M68_982880 [compost metagenome]